VPSTARVVYVDVDPVAVAFTRLTVGEGDRVGVVCADVRQPAQLLPEVAATGVIDFGQPVGLLMVGLLNFITDEDDPARMLHSLRQALAPGSFVAVSHVSTGPDGWPSMTRAGEVYRSAQLPLTLRSRAEITALFEGFRLLEPGLVPVDRWRPDDEPGDEPVPWLAGVAAMA
jgi:O-methyltransferase involved in polyketide biosynthesis